MTDPYRRFSIRLYKHTGAVILWHQQRYRDGATWTHWAHPPTPGLVPQGR